MEGIEASRLRIWHDTDKRLAGDRVSTPIRGAGRGRQPGDSFAERLYCTEAMQQTRHRSHAEIAGEPYSLQWFLNLEVERHGRRGQWLPRLLEFAKHSGETLLAIGQGMGTDWLPYARHGASVIVCGSSPQQLALVHRNFELRGLPGRFLHARLTALPIDSASIDVVCFIAPGDGIVEPQRLVAEIHRVLKPGGKVLCVMPARLDAQYWYFACFPWLRWFSRNPKSSANAYSARELRSLFTDFVDHRFHKRHLNRADVPHIWRWMPRSLLQRVMGRFLILKAFKPLPAAASLKSAA